MTPGIIRTMHEHPQTACDLAKLLKLSADTVTAGNDHEFGAIVDLDHSAAHVAREDVDAPSYLRWLLYKASGEVLKLPKSIEEQRHWAQSIGFEPGVPADCHKEDGFLRIAFRDASEEWREHVTLVLNGQTLESRYGHGPDSREWTGRGYSQGEVYVLKAATP